MSAPGRASSAAPSYGLLPATPGCQYHHQPPPVHHFDLYRLAGRDLLRLSLAESFADATCLVEWSERLVEADALPAEHLAIHISIADEAPAAAPTRPGPTWASATERPSSSTGHSDCRDGHNSPASSVPPSADVMQSIRQVDVPGTVPAKPLHFGDGVYSFRTTGDEGAAEATAEDEAGEDEDEEYDEYSDRRVRLVVLQPVGRHWAERVAAVVRGLQAETRPVGRWAVGQDELGRTHG